MNKLIPLIVLSCLLPLAANARTITATGIRAVLADVAPAAQVAPTAADAIAMATRSAASSDLICVTGSLMLVGEIKALFRGCSLSPLRG